MLSLLNPIHRYLMIGKLVALLGAIAVICFQSSQIHRWHVQNDRNADKANALSEKLHEISSKRDQQAIVTQEKIRVVTKTIHDRDQEAQKVEQAPPAPDCKTKPEVLNADV